MTTIIIGKIPDSTGPPPRPRTKSTVEADRRTGDPERPPLARTRWLKRRCDRQLEADLLRQRPGAGREDRRRWHGGDDGNRNRGLDGPGRRRRPSTLGRLSGDRASRHEGGFEAVHRHCVLPGTKLDTEVPRCPGENAEGPIIGRVQRSRLAVPSDQHTLSLQKLWRKLGRSRRRRRGVVGRRWWLEPRHGETKRREERWRRRLRSVEKLPRQNQRGAKDRLRRGEAIVFFGGRP